MRALYEPDRVPRCARCLRQLYWKIIKCPGPRAEVEISPCKLHPTAGALYAFDTVWGPLPQDEARKEKL